MNKKYHAMAKESFSLPKQNGIRPSFTKNQVYECLKLGNGNFAIMNDTGKSIELDPEYALKYFWIKDN